MAYFQSFDSSQDALLAMEPLSAAGPTRQSFSTRPPSQDPRPLPTVPGTQGQLPVLEYQGYQEVRADSSCLQFRRNGGAQNRVLRMWRCEGTWVYMPRGQARSHRRSARFLRSHYMRIYAQSSGCILRVMRHIQGSQIPSRLR